MKESLKKFYEYLASDEELMYFCIKTAICLTEKKIFCWIV